DLAGPGFISQGGNLIGNITSDTAATQTPPGLFNPLNGDQVGSLSPIDAQLGQLGDNGGPTQTMLPGSSSPAIDTGLVAAGLPLNDQRGFERTFGGLIDIGAVQVQNSGKIVSQVILTTTPASPTPGKQFMVNATVGPLVVGATTLLPD